MGGIGNILKKRPGKILNVISTGQWEFLVGSQGEDEIGWNIRLLVEF